MTRLSVPGKLLIAAFTLISTLVLAESKPVEIFVVDYPPYTMVDEQSVISGIDIDVVTAAFAEVDIDVTFRTAPWPRIRKNLEHGHIAGYTSCARRPEREPYILFSDKVSEANQVALMAKTFDARKLKNLEDLKQYKVSAIEGWAIQKELVSKQIPHSLTPDMDSGIRSVVFRDVDIFYIGELTSLYQARKLGLQDKIKTQRFTDKTSSDFYLCLSKGYPGNTELLEKFNTGLRQLKASGEFDEIYRRYL